MLSARPKPRREFVPLERLTFDARLQLRALPGGSLFDESHVLAMLEAREAGTEFPPLEAVEESQGAKRLPLLWVFSGYHRGEVLRRLKVASVECLVYPGRFADAEFFALSANSRKGKTRTPEDCRRAFDRLIDTPAHLGRVLESVEKQGSVLHALAHACGLATTTFQEYLTARGLRVDRHTRKLLPAEAPSPVVVERQAQVAALAAEGKSNRAIAAELGIHKATVAADKATAETQTAARASQSADPDAHPQEQESDEFAGYNQPSPVPFEAGPAAAPPSALAVAAAQYGLEECQRLLRALDRAAGRVLAGRLADHLRTAAARAGVPFGLRDVAVRPQHINDPTDTGTAEYWPIVTLLQGVFSDAAGTLAQAGAA